MSNISSSNNKLRPMCRAGLIGCMAILVVSCSSSTSNNPSPPSAPSPSVPTPPSSGIPGPSGVPAPMPTPPSTEAPGASTPSTGSTPDMPAPGSPSESPDGTNPEGEGSSSNGPEPGFGDDAAGGDDLPDMRDEPPGGQTAGTASRGTDMPGPGNEDGDPAGTAESGTGTPTKQNTPGNPGDPAGSATAPADDPLSPEDQVAILDAELQRGEAEFDDIIRESQEEQRRSDREDPPAPPSAPPAEQADQPYGGGISRSGNNDADTGRTGGVSSMPSNPAKYPPPQDIPSGDDDDVLARQLREAAMREPDPQVREKLWEEYRKYKGIEK